MIRQIKPTHFKRVVAHAAALLPLAMLLCGAATVDVRGQAVAWSADVVDSDLRKDVHELRGNVHVEQGPISLQAERAVVSALRSDHSEWNFTNAVHIRTPEADLTSNTATAALVKGQIADAQIKGSPAQFQQLGGEPDRQIRGRAGIIEYDFTRGIVKLRNNVWFSYGGDEFRGETVIYNLRDERVQVNPSGESSGRVNVTIRPHDAKSESKKSPAPAATKADGAAEGGA